MPVQMILFVLALLLISGLFHIIPGLTRPDIFFAVTVAPEFRRTPDARRILGRFRIIVWSCTLVAIALQLAAGLALVTILIQGTGFLWALVSSHGRTLAYAAPSSPVREVNLAAPPERLPGGLLVALLPLISLVALGLWASLNWNRLPRHLPVHTGLRGADRWVATTPATVFGLLAVQASMCLMLLGIAWGLLNWSRRISTTGSGAAGERSFRRRVLQLIIVTGYFLPCPAWFALLQAPPAAIYAWALALAAVIIAFVVTLFRAGQGGSLANVSAAAPPTGDRTPDSCWKWGIFYVNPADPSILVEKRFGIGYTINLGNRRSWLALALVLVPLAVGLIFLR